MACGPAFGLYAGAPSRLSPEQAELLSRIHERSGLDVHVAKLMLFEHPERGLHSLCTWISGVAGWLPRVDEEFLLTDTHGKDGYAVAWAEAIRVVGHRLKPVPDLIPPRWIADTFPSPEELACLKSASEGQGRANLIM